ncbi:hypothetical protein G6S93_004413 [Salmonella enterica]|nr:hypothetical protein [Salmonella enterica]
MSDLYFDTTQFDFNNLVDVVETTERSPAPYVKANEVNQDGGLIHDASDLYDPNTHFGADAEEEEAEPQDFNNDLSDLVNREQETAEKITIVNDLADDVPLDFGGLTATKRDAIEALKFKQKAEQQNSDLDSIHSAIKESKDWFDQDAFYGTTAVDMNIEHLERVLQNPALTDTEHRRYTAELSAAHKARQAVVDKAAEKYQVWKSQQNLLIQRQERATDAQMVQIYPNWYQWKDQLVNSAIADGMDKTTLTQLWTPALADRLLKAYMFDSNKQRSHQIAYQKAHQAKAARQVESQATAQRTKVQTSEQARKRELINKMQKGGLSREENAKMFDYLID